MARIDTLSHFLTDVSTAIKQKIGDSSAIPASQFDTKIASITTGGTYQEKSLNITTNGNINLLPDQGYDAMSKVNINVNVSSGGATSDATLQAKYLLQGYSAVVNDVLIQGTMVDRGTVTITATSSDVTIPEGHYDTLSIPAINASNCEDYTECDEALDSI